MSLHIEKVSLIHGKYPTREHYPFSLPLFRQTESISFETPVTFFAGENGTGKSTMLEALARACRIHIWRYQAGARYRYNPHEDKLHLCMKVTWKGVPVPGAFFGSETFKDFTLLLDEWAATDPGQLKYFGGESLVSKSHGQSMMSYFRTRYAVKGLYLLDEPETALSPRSQLELMEIIRENSEAGHAQFIITTHSPILLSFPGARIYSFDEIPLKTVGYEETDHFRLYRDFFNQRK
jgi:predicted ATPase